MSDTETTSDTVSSLTLEHCFRTRVPEHCFRTQVFYRSEMSQAISEYVSYSKERGECIEKVVERYESADTVILHNCKTETKDANVNAEHTGLMTAGDRCYIMAVVCVLLLCFLLLIAATALWIKFSILNIEKDQLQNTYDTLIIEMDQLHTSYKKMAVEKSQLQRSYMKMTFERDHLRTRNNNLTKERVQQQAIMDRLEKEYNELQSNFSTLEMQEKLKWVSFSSSSYYISERKDWTESRKDCTNRGADLVIIDSKDEQEFINKHLSKSQAWIGLTDRESERTWKWVDGTSLNPSYTYWRPKQPSNTKNEDCVMVSYPKKELCWNDAKCFVEAPWICEKKGSD